MAADIVDTARSILNYDGSAMAALDVAVNLIAVVPVLGSGVKLIGKAVEYLNKTVSATSLIEKFITAQHLNQHQIRKTKTVQKFSITQTALNLINQFASGNTNPGIGCKNLFKDVNYLRGRNGAKVFYRLLQME